MIRIETRHLSVSEKNLVKRFATFVISRFVSPRLQKNLKIRIRIIFPHELEDSDDSLDLRKMRAWVTQIKKKKYDIIINAREINRWAIGERYRLKKVFMDLAHELVHVKQYLTGQMKDYSDGSVKFMGKKYSSIEVGNESYFEFPGEIEAFGREIGLYEMFWSSNPR